jgi:hypothetical protein
MLKIVELDSWSDFENIVKTRLLNETKMAMNGPVIFRGQPDSTLSLETTLERAAGKNLTVKNYYDLIKRILPKIEAYTGQKWDLPDYQDFYKSLKDTPAYSNNSSFFYLTYLRHFGFPSPLLDWTFSPYIAAYFAFKNVSGAAKKVAIYRYCASDNLSLSPSDNVNIFPIFVNQNKIKRHELQQSIYTICLKETNDQLCFINHEDPLVNPEDRATYIQKLILPVGERLIALQNLRTYNINSFSLFGTEESLLESLFLQQYLQAAIMKNITGSDELMW